jgi:hypothetical protein
MLSKRRAEHIAPMRVIVGYFGFPKAGKICHWNPVDQGEELELATAKEVIIQSYAGG